MQEGSYFPCVSDTDTNHQIREHDDLIPPLAMRARKPVGMDTRDGMLRQRLSILEDGQGSHERVNRQHDEPFPFPRGGLWL